MSTANQRPKGQRTTVIDLYPLVASTSEEPPAEAVDDALGGGSSSIVRINGWCGRCGLWQGTYDGRCPKCHDSLYEAW